jgi:choline dehydrogenase-like flavoprotein
MVGRVETDAKTGLVTGVHYHREGRWRFRRARNVVVAGYAIETPRLLLNSADLRHPDGLANSSGLVGLNLTVQANQAVWGTMEEEVRWYKGPPSLAITEHWSYEDHGKDFFGGYCFMSDGPLPVTWAGIVSGEAACGARLCAKRWRNTTIRLASSSSAKSCLTSATASHSLKRPTN